MLPLPETLTLQEARATLQSLTETIERADVSTLAIDASTLRSFDSSALAVLLESRRLALTARKGFSLRGLPAPLMELAGLYGVDELLGAPSSPDAAAA